MHNYKNPFITEPDSITHQNKSFNQVGEAVFKLEEQSKLIFIGNDDRFDILRDYLRENEPKTTILHLYLENEIDELCYNNSEVSESFGNKSITSMIISVNNLSKPKYCRLLNYCELNKIQVYIIHNEGLIPKKHFKRIIINNVFLLRILNSPLDIRLNVIQKRIFDVIFSFSICVFVMSWLTPIIALLIKLDSKGPVFFIQKRNGLNNEVFKCMKFRTLISNKECDTKQVTEDDVRITKLGHFLRKTSLDELPQFFNVLIGNMSVVGPRPHMIKHNLFYRKVVDKYIVRNFVKPGITGLTQVEGYRGQTESDIFLMKMRVKLDRLYIYKWSLFLDIKIILKTVKQVVYPNRNTF